jgi:isopentenyldiphosphate isomerase
MSNELVNCGVIGGAAKIKFQSGSFRTEITLAEDDVRKLLTELTESLRVLEDVRTGKASSHLPTIEFRYALATKMLEQEKSSNKYIRSVSKKLGIRPRTHENKDSLDQQKYLAKLLELSKTIENNVAMVADAEKMYYSWE